MLSPEKSFTSAFQFLNAKIKEIEENLKENLNRLDHEKLSLLKTILAKNKTINKEIAFQITDSLNFSLTEAKYFFSLVDYENARSETEKKYYLSELKLAEMNYNNRTIFSDEFGIISEWYYFPILELTKLDGFEFNAYNVAKKLTISAHEAQTAIDQLLKMGLLVEKDEKFLKSHKIIHTSNDLPSFSIRRHHHQMIQHARFALEEQHVLERDISSLTVAINKQDLKKAKQIINNFKHELSKCLSQNKSKDNIYQLNVQFFNLTGEH